ncbi:NAD(+) diphosphatase [Primorskyibacter flagellatus]|uniref:NAD(+) diphosphatase n=1 Tax=Primorskyibacter flagellatus TaxID=1387277 RepID=UPI003A93F824
MQFSETVTFGGSSLDRAAEMRGDAPKLKALTDSDASRAVLFWRGKPLVAASDDGLTLAKLSMRHPILTGLADPVFLGRESEGTGYFAYELRGWVPEGLDEAALQEFLDQSEQTHPALTEGQHFAELRAVMTRVDARDAELAATGKAILGWHATHGFCAACGVKSDIFMAGWQRICPVCKTHHFPRTDPVVIMLVTRGNSVLLGRSPHWPDGMYSLLAGFIEPGETMEAAVRREVYEEAGIRIGHVRYLASQPWAFPSSLMLGCTGEALTHEITLDPVELEDALWITREELMEVFAGRRTDILPTRKGAIAQFLLSNWLADRGE